MTAVGQMEALASRLFGGRGSVRAAVCRAFATPYRLQPRRREARPPIEGCRSSKMTPRKMRGTIMTMNTMNPTNQRKRPRPRPL
jgi:hypothetical protein